MKHLTPNISPLQEHIEKLAAINSRYELDIKDIEKEIQGLEDRKVSLEAAINKNLNVIEKLKA